MGACSSKPKTDEASGGGGGRGQNPSQNPKGGIGSSAGSGGPKAALPKDVTVPAVADASNEETDLEFNSLLASSHPPPAAVDTVGRDHGFVAAEPGSKPNEVARGVLNNLLHWSPYSLCVSDIQAEDQPLIYANEVFQEITGYHEHELVGRNCRFLQGPDSDPEVINEMRRCINLGEEFVGEIINYSKDGRRLFNRLIMSPVRNKDGIVTHYTGIQRFTEADDDVNFKPLVPKNDPASIAETKRDLRRKSALAVPGAMGAVKDVSVDGFGRVARNTSQSQIDPSKEEALFGGGNVLDSAPIKEVTVQRRRRRQGGEVNVQADANIWLELVLRVLKFDATPALGSAAKMRGVVIEHIKDAGAGAGMGGVAKNALREREGKQSLDIAREEGDAAADAQVAKDVDRRTTVA
uniref:Putative LOV domain-containing protein n=1 Tax=Nephroselmis pyriformis TaxID=156128 RepID=A0A126WYK3_9CHLO|nr:putative LOV domain-containing protein [Nephroselmis pyriformis]